METIHRHTTESSYAMTETQSMALPLIDKEQQQQQQLLEPHDADDVLPPRLSSNDPSRKGYRLVIGTTGIYVAFLFYGSLQEDVFGYQSKNGARFGYAWMLLVLEAIANVGVASIGRQWERTTSPSTSPPATRLPMRQFAVTGASQVFSKAFTGLSLAKGLSFPVATLAKSGKMAPVMIGQLLIGGTTYSLREYLQVGAIIAGTALLSLCKKKGESNSSAWGVVFILLSLVMDGVTGGVQKRLKSDMKLVGLTPRPFDFMLFTNLSMMTVAFGLALIQNEFVNGWAFLVDNPDFRRLIVAFCLCSAFGQAFIFYTVVHFDPLVCSTVTTTRKIFSVLLSLFLKGHELSFQGWAGVLVAIAGIVSEVHCKITKSPRLKSKVSSI